MVKSGLWAAGLAMGAALFSAVYLAAAGDMSEAVLHTASGERTIALEVADTPETRRTGLMNRESMPADQGMLFVFDRTRPITMWMKNTLIPLDMLFLTEDGTVSHIHTNAEPMSLDTIPSGGPARYVVELNAGAAQRYGVETGDRLEHPAIPPEGDGDGA